MNITVESPDFNESFAFDNIESFLKTSDPKLSLLKESYKAFKSVYESFDILGEWVLKSESPAGSGLGGSSSLLISILKVFSEVSGVILDEDSLVTWAKNTETRVLGKPAGVQDYYPAVKSGLNKISFEPSGAKRETLSDKSLKFLNDHLILVDSHIKHHSGMNNWEIFKRLVEDDHQVKGALVELASIANSFESAMDSNDLNRVKDLFDREVKARKQVSDSYFNSELQEFCSKLEAVDGVLSYKVCGAGGGGCVLCAPKEKDSVKSSLDKLGVSVLPFELVS